MEDVPEIAPNWPLRARAYVRACQCYTCRRRRVGHLHLCHVLCRSHDAGEGLVNFDPEGCSPPIDHVCVSRVRRVRNQVVASRRPAAFPKLLPEFCCSHEKRLGQTLAAAAAAAALVCLNVHLHVWLACVCCHGPTHTSRHIAQLGAPETETLVLLLHINNPPPPPPPLRAARHIDVTVATTILTGWI